MARRSPDLEDHARAFAALGDATRLALVSKLCSGQPQSIVELTHGAKLSRQGVTKHLRVLEEAGIVESVRVGRESLFQLRTESIESLRAWLDLAARQWDVALDRLRAFVED